MKGICFKEPLFHLTVQGEKTQTRRIIPIKYDPVEFERMADKSVIAISPDLFIKSARSRYKVGETVYLKEPYHLYDDENNLCLYKYPPKEDWLTDKEFSDISASINKLKGWKNKLFMPEKYARCFIKITAVRAERLRDISDEDCIKEGISLGVYSGCAFWGVKLTDGTYTSYSGSPREAYKRLIDKINGPGTWENNPWVWVYDYELTNAPAI